MSESNGQGQLAGQITVVTGGASGIGRATSLRLAREGAAVVVVDISEERIRQTVNEIHTVRAEADTLSIIADVRKESDMEKMVDRVVERFERIDILVHSAGILRAKNSGPRILAEISTEEYDEVVGTNLKGTFLCNRAVLRTMIKQRSGQIVNISSTSGQIGRAFDSVYCASKFGVVGLTEALAEEVRQYNIKVFLVLPDAVDTPLWARNGPIRAPDYSLPPDRVAELIEYMVCLPPDTILQNVVIAPFRGRKRKKVKTTSQPETSKAGATAG